ncbi:exopolygalacturonase-like [Euphorbia lathyris]|uniref:exopolygalacturonase-like n=1 Tax=Euphorbia lathyris TaxID=212925 RepID=UPI0033137C51
MLSTLLTILIVLSSVEVKAKAPVTPGEAGAKGGGGGDITKFGAKPYADCTQAIMNAWKEACAAEGSGVVTVPEGTFVTGPVTMTGPCKGEMTFNLDGTLEAPPKLATQGWISFDHVDKLRVTGTGTLDGRGQEAWNCAKNESTCKSPTVNLRLDYVTNALVDHIVSFNSKNFHMNVISSTNITFQKVAVIAPDDSPKLNGIHVARSKGVTIKDVNIATSGDCISVGDGTSDLKVIDSECTSSHGISIGSLGLYPNEQPVTGVTVQGCTLTKAKYGVRIKSWADKYASRASGVKFSDITMEDVENPIIIDMMYCPSDGCNIKGISKVKLSDISFKGIKGTTPTIDAILLNCLPGSCTNIALADIDLKFTGTKGPAKANCTNIKPTLTGTVNPAGC